MGETGADKEPSPDLGHAGRIGLWALGIGFGGFLLWAALAPLDEGVPSQGHVAIDTKRKSVQHLSGGIIKEVFVGEGDQVKALPGIGDWTAQYIAMRALRWPDAFPAGDVALQNAMGVRQLKNPAKQAEHASLGWKPWRSYAVIRAWGGFLDPASVAASSSPTPFALLNS